MSQGMEYRSAVSAHVGSKYRFLLIFALALLVQGILSQSARASIRESDGAIVDRATKQTLNLLPRRNIGIQTPLPSGDVYLIITQGAAYVDVRLLADSSVPPQRLAKALESAVQGTTVAQSDVEYSSDDDYSAALVHFSQAHIGLKSQETELSVIQLAANIHKAGFGVQGILKIPRYASTAGLPSIHGHSSQYYWYNTNTLLAPSIRVQASMTPFQEFETVLFPFFVPVVTLLGILVALFVGRSQRFPIALRRRLYLKLVWYPCFSAIGLHIFYMLYFVQSPVGRLAGDLWFGSSDATIFISFVAIGPLAIMLAVPFATKMERRLYGNPENATPAVEEKPEEAEARKNIFRITLAPMVVGLGLMVGAIFVPARQTLLHFGLQFGGILIAFGSTILVRFIFKKEVAVLESETSDEELTMRAERIAQSLGTTLGRIRINETLSGRRYASAMAMAGGRIVVSRKLVETLDPDELDFILAHELAHVQGRHVPKQLALALFGMLLLWTPLILTSGGRVVLPSLLERDALFLTPLLGMAIVFAGLFYLRRKREYAADRKGLEVTRNLPAAESALLKITQFSPYPYLHDTSDLPTHPKLSKRLDALRGAAREIGLETAPVAGPVSDLTVAGDHVP